MVIYNISMQILQMSLFNKYKYQILKAYDTGIFPFVYKLNKWYTYYEPQRKLRQLLL